MIIPKNISVEVLLIDNNSSDNTKTVIEGFKETSDLTVIYLFEKNQGKINALNTGLNVAKGDIICFTDDDAIVDKNWLVNIVKAFEDTGAACIGGKVLPIWEKPPPKWLKKELYGCIALLDLGNDSLRLKEPTIWGVNIAIKSEVLRRYNFQFNPKFFNRGEDTDLVSCLIRKGEKVYYRPEILVYHCITEKRMRKSYFLKWKYEQGKFRGLYMYDGHCKNIMGIPLFAIKATLAKLFRYLFYQTLVPDKAFIEQVHLMHYLGFIIARFKTITLRINHG